MSLLIADGLGKKYDDVELFSGVSFTIEPGQKLALVAPNGAGKSTLFRILLGQEEHFDGIIQYDPGVRVGYLPQDISLDGYGSLWEYVISGDSERLSIFREYWDCKISESPISDALSQKMDVYDLWGFEGAIHDLISRFELPADSLEYFSGGQIKRAGLLRILLEDPDLFLLDEPTNHLDHAMLHYLEQYLKKSGSAVLVISHDRYFLDAVVSGVIEIDKGQIFRYKGNYSTFVAKKEDRLFGEKKSILRARSLLKKEKEWLSRGAEARRTKSQFRIDRISELEERASEKIERTIEISAISQRLGGKIIECEEVHKSFDDTVIVSDFTYSFEAGQKIGIIGPNGIGKTSFLRLLLRELVADSGSVEHGATLSFGYFRQHFADFDEDITVIDTIRQFGEAFFNEQGRKVPISKLLEKFMFEPRVQYQRVSTLSGGQKKRLTLLSILVQNPNFLILDEPTNDLDIQTLHAMEEFLLQYGGCVLMVSHDRYFLDAVADSLFIFKGDGIISPFEGTYTHYMKSLESEDTQVVEKAVAPVKSGKELKLAQKRREKLMRELEKLEAEKLELMNSFSEPLSRFTVEENSRRLDQVVALIAEKEDEWMSLS